MEDSPFEAQDYPGSPASPEQPQQPQPPPFPPPPPSSCPPPPASCPPPSQQKAPRKGVGGCLTGCLIGAIGTFALFVIVPLALICFLIGSNDPSGWINSSSTTANASYGEDECPPLTEVWSYGASCDNADAKVVRIPLTGTIMMDDDSWRYRSGSAVEALASIHYATLDDTVDGILLEIDSPGGGVTSSDILWDALKKFKAASSNRVVLVHMGDLCASGGYYVSMGADEIMALPTTMTGSIGVILSSVNIRQLAEKLGISDVTIASGKNKAMLNPFHDLTPEQQAILQKMIDSMHQRFIGIVAEGRGLPREKVAELADGRIFLSSEAKNLGLIDGIGYFEDAYKRMNELLGVDESYVVRYKRDESFKDLFRRSRLLGMADILRKAEAASSAKLLFMAGR